MQKCSLTKRTQDSAIAALCAALFYLGDKEPKAGLEVNVLSAGVASSTRALMKGLRASAAPGALEEQV